MTSLFSLESTIMKLILIAALIGVACSSPNGKINADLASKLESGKANVMISFVGGNKKIVDSVENRVFQTRGDRLTTLKQSLHAHAADSQANVQNLLKEQSVEYKSFWITNQIYIKGASKEVVQALANFAEVSEISEELIIPKNVPVERGPVSHGKVPTPLNEWGLEIIKAPEAWEITKGEQIVVSNIDGGVRGSHEALKDRKRSDYNWFDPYGGTEEAWDEADGHGTHTMGSITGSNGIGVAPGATWIACKGCGLVSCSQSALTACGEFMLCPTKPDGSDEDCTKAPNLVSNSWGGGQGSTTYEGVTEAWIAGGILPLFSQGNSGPSCGSANSPGDLRRVIGVGATSSDDSIAYFSSVGPSAAGRLKPEISAPGENIRSALSGSDTAYGSMSGTSMSCPHAAGVAALALSINPNMTFGEIRKVLIESVDTSLNGSGKECGGISDSSFPNHIFGYGRINALKAAQAAKATLK